jgi:hypothetical protein
MNISQMAKRAEKIVTDNSPAILTAIGVTGTITTAYLTGRASFKAAEVIKAQQFRNDLHETSPKRTMDNKDKFLLVWKLYIPAGGMAVTTVACIVMANHIGTRRAAAVAAAYSISEKAFTEYRDKVVEKIGENKEREVRDEVAQDRVNRAAANRDVIMVTDGNKVMCHDAFSNQFFMSDMETLRKAQNDINAQILHADYATVNDFYDFVDAEGLDHTSVSGDLGWNTDKMLEIDFATVLYKDKTPCISVVFATVPVRDPWRFC